MGALEALAEIQSPRVLVLGDLILDRYVWGSVDRISPEAPIQVLAVKEEEDRLGGAGNVAANLAALNAEAFLVGILGKGPAGDRYLELCRESGIHPRVLRVDDRPTIRKSRYIAQSQQVLRVDQEEVFPLHGGQVDELLQIALELIDETDIILLSDYAKGTLTSAVMGPLFAKARRAGLRVVVDPKGVDFSRYRGASLITPNRREASMALGRPLDDEESLVAGMRELRTDLGLDAMVVTLGPEGIAYLEGDDDPSFISARAQAVFDVSGAGDTVLSVIGMFLGAGRSLAEAVEAANAAGGVVVGKLGTAQATRDEIARLLSGATVLDGGKLIDRDALVALLADIRPQGARVVFTNGCFDLLHPGHIRLLREARELGDILVVAINSDASVRALKGDSRPLLDATERAEMLGALEAVDYVVIFDEPDPIPLLELLRPDVLIKGGDYEAEDGAVGAELVKGYGGEVRYSGLAEGHSTSAMIDKIRGADA